jgi:hypothetical protein
MSAVGAPAIVDAVISTTKKCEILCVRRYFLLVFQTLASKPWLPDLGLQTLTLLDAVGASHTR